LIGKEAFADGADLRRLPRPPPGATIHNQDAWPPATVSSSSEGTVADVRPVLALDWSRNLGVDGTRPPPWSQLVPADLRDEIDALRQLDPYYRGVVRDGRHGIVVRSKSAVISTPTAGS